ncbi:MAG: NADH-quinone oxidoreductase subunit NuoG [Acidobacteriota bacterium]|nr:NADH-quinone oxidoreductase subunit NuoG [Acidobacteriota bacterium]
MAETPSTVTITLNGRPVVAAPGELLISVAERAGTYIPRFCYHPRMEPVGVCRMCLVEVEGPRGATLQPSCYLRVNDGMAVVTDSEKVKKAQDGVMEFLLANHPLDCPVCDKGGECPLQDQAVAHGSGETRFIEEKRHFEKPISIGELVLLDRERCIQCSRCTRFAAEVAGEAQIDFAGRGDLIEVAASPTQPFDSVFSGNTVQICPVGALTAKAYRFTARPWDLEQVESTCTTCAVGCRVAVQSSGNRLTRVLGLDSEPVNHGWLCDKGRFSLDSVDGNEESTNLLSAATRVTSPLVRRDGELVATSWSEALAAAASLLGQGDAVGVIGGAALTNESAYAWSRFAREVLATENVDANYGDGLDATLLQALPGATIDEAARARVILTMTGDLRQELPVLFLRLRAAALTSSALIEFSFGASALRSVARVALPVRPGEAHLVARALAGETPSGELAASAEAIRDARDLLGDGEGVVIVAGRPNLAEDASVIETALRTFAEHFPRATFLPALRRSNVRGALDMGLAPGLRAGRRAVAASGRDTLAQLDAMAAGVQDSVLLLGGCVLGNVLDVERARAGLARANVVVVTGHGGATLAHADVVLPAAISHERRGTVTNLEGRVSALAPKLAAPGAAWDDVAIAGELAVALGSSLEIDSVEMAAKLIEETTGYPALSVLNDEAAEGVWSLSGERSVRHALDPMAFPGVRSTDAVGQGSYAGDTVSLDARAATPLAPATWDQVAAGRGADLPHVDAYSLRLYASRRLYDAGIAMQGSPALAGLVEETTLYAHHADLDRLGVATGDVVNVVGANASVVLPVASDDAVPRGVAEVAVGTRRDGENLLSRLAGDATLTLVRLESR